MKITKTLVVTLLAGFVLNQTALCQTNATDASPADAGVNTTNAAGAMPAMAEGGVTASNVTAGAGESSAPAAQPPEAATAGNGTAGASAAATQLPIQFQDVPITTAIESLARLAAINYLLDPKIGYGQPDQSGQVKPEPTLSIRWENVTAQQALLALLDNYGLQLLENPKTGIYKVTTKEPNALPPLITRVIQLQYASTSNMTEAVQSVLTDKNRSKVIADRRTSQLVVVATEKEQADVDAMISQLDKPTRQVLIETKFVELSSNPTTSKGIDWSGTLQAQNVSFGNGVLQPSVSSTTTTTPGATTTTPGTSTTTPAVVVPPVIGPGGAIIQSGYTIPGTTTTTPGSSHTAGWSALTETVTQPQSSLVPGGLSLNTARGLTPGIGFLSADGAKAVLSFLNQSLEAQVISTPRLVTLDNETATISVTRAFPIMNVTAGTANTTGGSQLTYSNLGTILLVTPRISANDYIWLRVTPTLSSFSGRDTQTINGLVNTADIFDMRSIDTQVLIPNAHTLVMGGFVQDNPNAGYTKVPLLGDIPILGLAFRHETKTMQKDDLLIFITPTIVRDADFKPTTSHFLDSQPRAMKDPMNMHSAWDSSEPRGNWSNPVQKSMDESQSQDKANVSVKP